MTPADLEAALAALTGSMRDVASSLGYSRPSIYALLDGKMPIKPETAGRIAELLRERRDAIDAVLGRLSPPS